MIRHYFRSTKISSALYRIFSCRQYIKLKNNQCCPYKPRYSLFSSYCSRGNTSCCKHPCLLYYSLFLLIVPDRIYHVANIHLLYQTIEKEVKSLHDTAYSLSLVPEGLHHVANIDTYCIKSWEKWVLRNLPSKYLQILSRDDFVSMWRRIIGTRHQILYFNFFYTERMRGQWLHHKHLKFKRRIPFYPFKGVFYWKN